MEPGRPETRAEQGWSPKRRPLGREGGREGGVVLAACGRLGLREERVVDTVGTDCDCVMIEQIGVE